MDFLIRFKESADAETFEGLYHSRAGKKFTPCSVWIFREHIETTGSDIKKIFEDATACGDVIEFTVFVSDE